MSVQSLLAVTHEAWNRMGGCSPGGYGRNWQSHYGQAFRMCFKRKWQLHLPAVSQQKASKPNTHAKLDPCINNRMCMHLHKHATFYPQARDAAWCNKLIGLLKLSRARVNCSEKQDGFTLYSPSILSELIPQTNHCGCLLSTNPVMPRRALKSSTQQSWEQLWLNGSRSTCMMNSSQKPIWCL